MKILWYSQRSSVLLLLALLLPTAQARLSVPSPFKAASSFATHDTVQNPENTLSLTLGAPVERELAGGAVHTYQFTLSSGQFLRVIADQRGIDVVLTLFGPDGKKVAEVDSPNGRLGLEPLGLIASATGNYRLEVRSIEKESPPGRYAVKLAELRAATPRDETQIAAERKHFEATQIANEGTGEAWKSAIEKYSEALSLYQAVSDHKGEAQTLNMIGIIHNLLGEKPQALSYFNRTLTIWQQLVHNPFEEGATLNNIGMIYDDMGEKHTAFDFYSRSLSLRRAALDSTGEATTLINLGSYYHSLGESLMALTLLEQALKIALDIKDYYLQAGAYRHTGLVHYDLGEDQKALEFFNKELPISQAENDFRGQTNTLNLISLSYNNLGESEKALNHLYEALRLSGITDDRQGRAYTLANFGRVYERLGEHQKALDHYNQSLEIQRSIKDLGREAATLYDIAQVKLKQKSFSEAASYIKEAVKVIESLRSKVINQKLRTSYFASIHKYYELYINLLMRLHVLEPSAKHNVTALEVSEQARSRSLLELLNEAGADIRQGVNPKLLERERSVRQRLTVKAAEQTHLLSGKHTQEQADKVAKEIAALTTEYEDVEAEIRQTSPHYAELKSAQPITLREIQGEVLDQDTLLLEYALGADDSYLWAVTSTSVHSFKLPKREQVEDGVRGGRELLIARNVKKDFEDDIKKGRRVAAADAEYPAAAATLSQMLLGPVAELLKAKKRLLIVSDGALQLLPFGALPLPTAKVSERSPSNDGYVPLIVQHEIVGAPSVSVMLSQRRRTAGRRPADKALAVLADPVFDPNDERVKQAQAARRSAPSNVTLSTAPSQAVSHRRSLLRSAAESGLVGEGQPIERLKYTRFEAEQISAPVPPADRKLWLNFDASRQTVFDPALSQYRYIHFATHGLLNTIHPELSGIVLSLVDRNGALQDGFLRAHDIFNLRLPAEMVVLSACSTGLGKEVKGEGLIGITRGFMYAGAKRVAVSLWDVDDKVTATLMPRMYQGIFKSRLRPAAALRAAQIAMWKARRAPYYWSAFTIQGEWR